MDIEHGKAVSDIALGAASLDSVLHERWPELEPKMPWIIWVRQAPESLSSSWDCIVLCFVQQGLNILTQQFLSILFVFSKAENHVG